MPKTRKQKKAKKKKVQKYKTHSCELCEEIDCDEMVRCDTCDLWFHFACVNITSIGEEDPWECPTCVNSVSQLNSHPIASNQTPLQSLKVQNSAGNSKATNASRSVSEKLNQNLVMSSNIQGQGDRVGDRQHQLHVDDNLSQSHESGRQSQHTRSSVKRRTQLELDRIEEERQLRERRDKEYLDEKYRILANDCSSESDRRSTDRSSFTRSWVRESLQVNQPSTGEHSISSSQVNEVLHANQALSDRFRSSSMDKLNPRLSLGPEKVFLKKVDQMVLNESKPKDRQQIEKQVGLSINKSAPTVSIRSETIRTRPSCPAHDARLHMFPDQILPIVSEHQGCDANKQTFSNRDLPIVSNCLSETNFTRSNENKNSVNEKSAKNWNQPKGCEYRSEYHGGLIRDEWSKFYPRDGVYRGGSKNVQSTPRFNQENTDRKLNFNFPSQIQSDGLHENTNHKPLLRKSTFMEIGSDINRDNYEYLGETEGCQSDFQKYSNYWSKSERSKNHNPHQPIFHESMQVEEPRRKTFPDNDYKQRERFNVERGYAFDNQDCSGNCRAAQNHISQIVPEVKVNVNGSHCSNIRGLSQPFFDPWLNELSHHQNSILTKNQIASRQVVDKKLKVFSGNPDEWAQWYRKFKNTTKMCGLTNDENLERLEKCLEGKAKRATNSQLSFPSAVPWIINTLHMLFGRPEVIIKSQIDKIRDYPPVKSERLDSLMEFAFEVQNISATIESLERQDHLTDPMLVEELVNKLPSQEKKDWARYKMGKSNVTIKTLAIWLYELAQVLSSVTSPTTTKFNDQKSDDRRFDNKKSDKSQVKESARFNVHVEGSSKQQESVNSNVAKKQAQSPKKIFPCMICNKECDKVENCPVFNSYTTECRWRAVIQHKLCRKCLRRHKFPCRATISCQQNECQHKQKHHSLLHNNERHNDSTHNGGTVINASSNVHLEFKNETLVKIAPVMLHYGGQSVKTFAFFDDGSTATMMEKKLATQLGLKGTPEQLCLIWTKKIHRTELAEKVTLEISGINEFNHRYPLKGIRSIGSLELPVQSINKAELVEKYSYLKNVPLTDYKNAIPGILIGSDNPKLASQLKIVEGEEDDSPVASKTRLGWVVHGPRNGSNRVHFVNNHQFEVCPYHNQHDNEIHQRVKEYFSIENFGVQATNKLNTESKDDQRALELLKKFTKKVDGKFETGLLWKHDNVSLPDSYSMAMRRLISLEKQGDKMVKAVGNKISDYVTKNYARKLTVEELKIDRPAWYLPPFGVIHPKKPEKLRMVFDAAAKVKAVSLNSMLLKGPDQFTSLIDILRRFREKKIAVSGDIREMYHQVRIREEDQHFQRFLFRNGESKREPDVYVMMAMTFGATCSPCAAQYVKNLNATEFKDTHPEAVKAIIENHYVDDMMDGADTEEAAIQLVQDVKFIHAKGGFEIRNFLSNSTKVLDKIGEIESIDGKDISPNSELKTERVLGMWWNMKNDVFTFSLKYTRINNDILSGKILPTKREILRTLMSIFDPLGLLSNYLIYLKILLQEVWRAEIGWDEQISTDNLVQRWKQWIEILPGVENVKIPRWYSSKLSPNSPKSIQIHVFVDASEDAFSAVIYLRTEDKDGVDCALIGSKARVAPLKYLSIPRKELQAGVLGTRLMTSISDGQSFKINRRIIWSDSETVLSWINSNHRKYNQFVAHRVGEILENSDVNEWRWIPTKENVADEATKWTKVPTFESNRWFKGPDFLRSNESFWPEKKKIKIDVVEEMKAHFAHSNLVIPQLIDSSRFSKWNRMVRALAYSIRFRQLFTGKTKKGVPLTQEELTRSENLIFRQAQFEVYPSEMVILERNKVLPIDQQVFIEKPSPLFDGTPYLDLYGVLRMKGRIDGARELSMDTKRPIVLPKESQITKLLVHHYHVKFYHQNHKTVVNEIRQRFYIPSIRVLLNKVKRRCQMCKVKLAHVMEPQMADLPPARVAVGFRPFSFVGVDYFGPMYVMIGRRKEKRWGVLFTCLTIRAIHIELAPSLNTNSCILCIRNFVADHGTVIEFHSDCGTNFKGADNELQREIQKIDKEQLQTEFTTTYTKWMFNPPSAAHMGGSWERLIRTVKNGMDQLMVTKTPREETLRNVLKEIQNVVNSRPLTFIPLEFEEDEALTPNHFLLGSSLGHKPPCKIDLDGPYLRQSWKEAQRLTELFWKQFIIEYLPTLARRTKWFKPVKPLEPDDLVLVIDEENPRNTYPKAKVVETKVGSNGQVRRVKVQLILEAKTKSNGQIIQVRKNELWKPAHKLALLDVLQQDDGFTQGLGRKTGGSVSATGSTIFENDRDNTSQEVKMSSTARFPEINKNKTN